MKIEIAANAGFCFGVERAVNIAFRLGCKCPNKVFTLGPIIHNPQVVEQLEKNSIHMVSDLAQIKEGIVIVRSHGLPPKIIQQAKKKGLDVVDATCPFVKKVQIYAMSLRKAGYPILLVGDVEHPEVVAIRGYVDNDIIICQSENEIERLNIPKRLGVVAQTTQDYKNFKSIIARLLDRVSELKIYNTICDSTIVRQQSTLDLARKVDLMVVAGGKNSANTNRLASISMSVNPVTYLVETPDEIRKGWFKGISKVGITAGASTPKWIINDIIKRIELLTNLC